ncbi:helix-turn-helix transcriptional regulator [Plantactinospora sp. S1510]|uniref:Helix-turn-helix transcriptional regulator n=1 Tax=Plantactinospora alkalitolerans TaxID=2789879 RepID=A0ABS0H5Q0_9ACTN|nr:TetR/AcrR family transcriptional regulator [Plantactinospora alkalitolerans]MBF9133791.1 helix-turn-helix transcriptional regulator [Plantactinospora alkalitolerans]
MAVRDSVDVESRARARTRRAILDAAITVLSQHSAASLADVADAAGVGRTTLHRYFPERAELLTALSADVLARIDAAAVRSQLDHGPAPAALERLCQELFELGDILMCVFSQPELVDTQTWEECSEADKALTRLVERGHAEGTLDSTLDPIWVQQVLWSLLYAAWQHTREHSVSKHRALDLCLRSLRKVVAASPGRLAERPVQDP